MTRTAHPQPTLAIVPVAKEERAVRRREARVEQILATALALAGEVGLEGLTMPRLAAELNYAVGALYRYFDSKEALLAALCRNTLARLGHALALQREALARDPAARRLAPDVARLVPVLAAADLYQRLPQTDPTGAELIARMIGEPRVLVTGQPALEILAAAAPVIGELALRLGDACPPLRRGAAPANWPREGPAETQRALVLWGGVLGVAQLRKLARFEPHILDTKVLTDELVRALLVGWGADPELVRRAEKFWNRNVEEVSR